MAYVGTPIDTTNQFQSLQGKRFSGDGSTTAFTLDIAPSSVFDIEVFVENVRQDPNSAYGISGTTLTFTGAPASGTNNIYVVHQAKAVGTIDVPASGVVPASLASNIISGQTALGATPATTDEFLISDAGTIKRVDYSHIGNTPAFYGELASDQTVSNGTQTKLASMTQNEIDTDTAFDGTTFTVPSGKAGKYYICTQVFGNFDDVGEDGKVVQLNIFKNGSSIKESKYETLTNTDLKFFSMTTSMLVDLSASDTIESYIILTDVNSGSGMKANDGQTFLSGYRLAGA
jgi:hypothetical protein